MSILIGRWEGASKERGQRLRMRSDGGSEDGEDERREEDDYKDEEE